MAKKSAERPKFTGILTQPIERPNRLFSPQMADEYLDFQRCERICALAEHYRIEVVRHKIEWTLYNVLICLAADLLDAFKVGVPPKRSRGRPKGTTKDDPLRLAEEIEKLQRERNLTILSACTCLAGERHWKPASPRALYSRNYRYKKNMADPMRVKKRELDTFDTLLKELAATEDSYEN
jgi:hypothetical protein